MPQIFVKLTNDKTICLDGPIANLTTINEIKERVAN